MLSDLPAERAILAGICRYGSSAYYDVADIIGPETFTIESNTIIFSCLKKILDADNTSNIDLPSILSVAKEMGVSEFMSSREEIQHLSSIMKFPVELSNIRKFAAKIRKLKIATDIHDNLDLIKDNYRNVKGDEPISKIFGIAEEGLFNFMGELVHGDESPRKVFEDVEDTLDHAQENKTESLGIPTGFPRYDFAIGGGLRRGTVNVIGARPKVGKTLFAENAGIHIARSGVPVLNLDTEMRREDHQIRGMGMTAMVEINDIETGKFSDNDNDKAKLYNKAKELKDIPYFHKSIGGMAFEEQLAVMRRWIAREVGIDPATNKAKKCVIIYDYLKLMDTAEMKGDLKEFQLLGFMMTALHNFSLQYDIPFLTFIQLNRDGISKESTDTASGSDRIIWLCSNFTIYKYKSDEEISKDGVENGNRKLVPVIARHGEGLQDNDYINVQMEGRYGKLTEGRTALELENGDTDDDNITEQDIPF